jgi:hypothetical protein
LQAFEVSLLPIARITGKTKEADLLAELAEDFCNGSKAFAGSTDGRAKVRALALSPRLKIGNASFFKRLKPDVVRNDLYTGAESSYTERTAAHAHGRDLSRLPSYPSCR